MPTRNFLAALAATLMWGQPALADEPSLLGYRVHGHGPEHVIMLHDWMGDASNYDAALPWLDETRFTYVLADVRGYGLSRNLDGEFTSDEVSGDITRLADHLGWSQFHLVGHSMNGMAGFKFLLNDSLGAKRLLSYVAVTPVTPDGYPATDEDRAFLAAAIGDDDTARMAFGALTGAQLNTMWGQVKTARNRQTSRPEALRGYYKMWLDEDFSDAFSRAHIDTPVLVIGGRNDLPGFQEAHYSATLATWLENVRFHYVSDAGHYPMQETPILFASLIEGHFSSTR